MSEALAGAQYSQKQESEADDYGFEFIIKHNIDPYAMYNALNKLLELSAEAPKESKFHKMFSSHPDTAKRVARAKEKADNYTRTSKFENHKTEFNRGRIPIYEVRPRYF